MNRSSSINQLGAEPIYLPLGDEPGSIDRRVDRRWREADPARVTEKLVRINRRAVAKMKGTARRAQHMKHHGCVHATFRVFDDIPLDLKHGLFAQPGAFEAFVRFSNGTGTDDREEDAHGMAIKVLGIPGTKLIDGRENEQAQDFILADSETFPSGDPGALVVMNRILSGRKLTKLVNGLRLLVFHPKAFFSSRNSVKLISSLLDTNYFSAIAYKLGGHAVKYVAMPLHPSGDSGQINEPNGLALELKRRLEPGNQAFVFNFGVDVRTDAETQPIEDPSIRWSDTNGLRRVWIGEIEIPRQDFSAHAGLAENLAFSPWHALEEHEPLGHLSRARRDVYRALARFRHEQNRVEPAESSEEEPSYRDGRPRKFGPLYWNGPKSKPHQRLWKKIQEGTAWFVNLLPPVISLFNKVPLLQRWASRRAINYFASQTPQRPLPLSLWMPRCEDGEAVAYAACVTWSGLTDRAFTGRHLPPMHEADFRRLPNPQEIEDLFIRRQFKESQRTSALFLFFAQWLSDSFLRTHPDEKCRNTSNHELDLCQIYGLGAEATYLLRKREHGLLKSQDIPGLGEMPPYLVDRGTGQINEELGRIAFDPVHATSFGEDPPHGRAMDLKKLIVDSMNGLTWPVDNGRFEKYYAGGLERANSTLLYTSFNTVFLREHNRLAKALRSEYGTDDDNWLFETARNINLVKYLKILVEDYINHLTGSRFKVQLAPGFADLCKWYRTNRITLEFNLLYRWHSMVPESFVVEREDGQAERLWDRDFRFNNEKVEEHGIERLIHAASHQKAGHVGLGNTPFFLIPAERKSIDLAREFRLAGFNAYRQRWGLPKYRSFEEMVGTDTPEQRILASRLKDLYKGDINLVEYLVGLFAEKRESDTVLPTLLSLMLASDAFSHALTNPLLAAYVLDEGSLTDFGRRELDRVSTFADIVHDNVAPGMIRPDVNFELR